MTNIRNLWSKQILPFGFTRQCICSLNNKGLPNVSQIQRGAAPARTDTWHDDQRPAPQRKAAVTAYQYLKGYNSLSLHGGDMIAACSGQQTSAKRPQNVWERFGLTFIQLQLVGPTLIEHLAASQRTEEHPAKFWAFQGFTSNAGGQPDLEAINWKTIREQWFGMLCTESIHQPLFHWDIYLNFHENYSRLFSLWANICKYCCLNTCFIP